MSQTKQDQAPPAPEGCVYGPWWDDCDGDNGAWFVSHFYRGLSAWDPKSVLWEAPGSRGHYDDIYGRELLRLAKENAELLLLIRRGLHSHTAPELIPVEEWKRDAMICLQEKEK